ncbi:hypothetical protein ACFC25_17865 [Pseudarthrobacter sp. NPDC055928]|uniref:hypothetical protein n=1 Tax=Pseudarthrobacter sp. NPDC055928 TaxID=3345661 RepID=UPI0035E2CF35
MGDSTTLALNLTFFGTLGLAFLMFLGLFLLVVATLVLAGVGRLVALMVMVLLGKLPRHETLPLVRLTGASGTASSASAADAAMPGHDDGAAATSPAKTASAGVLRAKAASLQTKTRTKTGAAVSAARTHGSAAVATLRAPRDWRKVLRDARTALKPSEFKPRFQHAVEHHPLLTAARRVPPVLAEDWAAAVAEADARALARARAAAPQIKVSVRDLPDPGVPAEKVVAVAPLVESALHQDHPARDVPRSFKKPSAAPPLSPLDTGSLVSLSAHAKVIKGKLPADRR